MPASSASPPPPSSELEMELEMELEEEKERREMCGDGGTVKGRDDWDWGHPGCLTAEQFEVFVSY